MPRRGAAAVQVRRSKYRAVPTVVNGFRFASKGEAWRYGELLLLGAAGELRDLELQPRFPLVCNGIVVAHYVADFRFARTWNGTTWHDVIEDVKGVRLPLYRLKKKLMEAQYGIVIQEVAA